MLVVGNVPSTDLKYSSILKLMAVYPVEFLLGNSLSNSTRSFYGDVKDWLVMYDLKKVCYVEDFVLISFL
jgi:hypothetical protein